MKFVLALLLLTVELGGAFGDASIEGSAISSGEVEVTVRLTVEGGPSTVVVHFVDPGDDQITVTLGHQSGGDFEGTAIVERADLVVVFEALWSDGTSQTSRPVTLTELGMDPGVLSDNEVGSVQMEEAEAELTLDATTERWGWAALALGAAALSLLAWWALADYPKRTRADGEEPTDQD